MPKNSSAVRSIIFSGAALAVTACSGNSSLPAGLEQAGGATGIGGAAPSGGQTATLSTPASGGTTGGGTTGGNAPSSNTAPGGTYSVGGSATGGKTIGGGVGGTTVRGTTTGSSMSVGGSNAGTGGALDPAHEPFVPGVAPTAAKYFKKGINLGNRLEAPNEGDWGGTVLATDFPFIAKRGFDHVRIPIRFSGHALDSAPYTINAAFFTRVDTVLDQAAQANLAVVLDLHAYDELAANVGAHRDRFLSLWTQIATHYRDRPDTVAFELLNEPYGQLDTTWNDLSTAAIRAVRATNPRRLLVVDAVYWADPSKLSVLTLPNDANVLVAVHVYEPKLFTFQGKSWMGPEFMTTGVLFPGPASTPITPVAAATSTAWTKAWFDRYNSLPAATNPSGPATITAQMAYITNYRSSSGRSVYNGEWGPQDGGAMDSRVRLVTMVRQECEKASIGWAIWEDPKNMKLFDSTANTWVTPIVDALLPP